LICSIPTLTETLGLILLKPDVTPASIIPRHQWCHQIFNDISIGFPLELKGMWKEECMLKLDNLQEEV